MSADDHGSASTYTNWRCRCDACREAWRIEFARMRRNRTRWLRDDPTLAQHGTESTYTNWGCRCAACTEGHRTYQRRAYQKRRAIRP